MYREDVGTAMATYGKRERNDRCERDKKRVVEQGTVYWLRVGGDGKF